MQTTSALIHDGLAVATPSMRLRHAARMERLAKFFPPLPIRRPEAVMAPAIVPTLQEPDVIDAPAEPVSIEVTASNGQTVSLSIAAFKEAQEMFERMSPSLSLDRILRATAAHFGVTVHDMKSSRRTANLVYPRHICMYLCKALTHRSLPEIGRAIGGRDHTTILYGVTKIEALIGNAEIDLHVAFIRAYLNRSEVE